MSNVSSFFLFRVFPLPGIFLLPFLTSPHSTQFFWLTPSHTSGLSLDFYFFQKSSLTSTLNEGPSSVPHVPCTTLFIALIKPCYDCLCPLQNISPMRAQTLYHSSLHPMELARHLEYNGCLINLCWRSDEWMLMVSGAIFLPSIWPAGLLTDTCSVYFCPSALCSPWGCTRWHRHWSGKACRSIQAPMSPFPTPLPINHSCLPLFKNMITMNPRGPPFMSPLIFFTSLNMGFISVTTRDTWRELQRV